jgi:hypothetical protein
MPFSVATKNAMLDAITFNGIRLHSGAPGASGTDNFVDSAIASATFSSASSSSRALASAVEVTGLAANQSVTHYSVWTTAGAVFRGSGTISSGDVAANSAGEFSLAVGTALNLNDA